MIKYLIFDFDGTVADSYEEMKRVLSANGSRSGIVNKLDQVKRRGFKEVIKSSWVPFWLLPGIRYLILRKVNTLDIKMFTGIKDEILRLGERYEIGIVSNNSRSNIVSTLEANGIADLFKFIYSGSFIFGKHRVLESVCKKYLLEPEDVVYIGDEDRDISAARKAGVRSIAVSWGYNSRERLLKKRPDIVVDSPEELESALVALDS